MARAKVKRRNTPRNITLELTEGEADYLLGLINMSGGDEVKSPRKYGDRIVKALERTVGYRYGETDAFRLARGHVEFRDYGTEERTIRQHLRDYELVARQFPERREGVESVRHVIQMVDTGILPNVPISEAVAVRAGG